MHSKTHAARRARITAALGRDRANVLRALYGPPRDGSTLAVGVAAGLAHAGLAVAAGLSGASLPTAALLGWGVGAWLEAVLFASVHDACHNILTGPAWDGWWVWILSAPSLNPYAYYYSVFHRPHHALLGATPSDMGDFDKDWDAARFSLYAPVPSLAHQSSVGVVLAAADAIADAAAAAAPWPCLRYWLYPPAKILGLTLGLLLKTTLELRDRLASLVWVPIQRAADLAGTTTFVTNKGPDSAAHDIEWHRAFDASVKLIYTAVEGLATDTLQKAAVLAALWYGLASSPGAFACAVVYLLVASLAFYGALGHPLVGLWLAFHVSPSPVAPCAPTGTVTASPWFNALTCNLGYHAEHHDFPQIPWTRLAAVRSAAPSFYTASSPDAHDIRVTTWADCYSLFLWSPRSLLRYSCPVELAPS